MSYLPSGADDKPQPFEPPPTNDKPWRDNDPWVFLAAQVNRFIASRWLEKKVGYARTQPMPLHGAVIEWTPWPAYGASKELATPALLIYQWRVNQGGYANDIQTMQQVMASENEQVKYLNDHVADVARMVMAVAEAEHMPAAQGIAKPFPWMLVGAGAVALVLVMGKKGGRR